jgi:eukaryotic-like serine/threonine-protein kinase
METPEPPKTPPLEIAHVLFMDIVAYSTLHMDRQQQLLHELQETVRSTSEFARAQAQDQLIRLPTGDGMALVFFADPEAAVRCAVELAKALRQSPAISLRMGIHTGPVYRVADINANRNVAGGGINTAQRVMDCGDAGHILVSSTQAEVLRQVSSWSAMLHDLGEVEVKHGVRLHIYNLQAEDAGNRELPTKIRSQRTAASWVASRRNLLVVGVAIIVALASVGGRLYYTHRAHALSATDTIVVADFTNTTGDAVFDDTLKNGLSIALRQSPFLNVLSDEKIAATLRLMTRPENTPLTPKVADEVCQRAESKAYIAGSIAPLGSAYIIGLTAVSCQDGDTLAQEQVMVSSKEKILDALGGAAAEMRTRLGESGSTVKRFNVPLEQATTSSLEALKAYSNGDLDRAIRIDPNFAMSYWLKGMILDNQGDKRAADYFTKAFQLREHASEREALTIAGSYYVLVTGELEKATETLEELVGTYPRLEGRMASPYAVLSNAYRRQGRYKEAMWATHQALNFVPDHVYPYLMLFDEQLAFQHPDEARQALQQAPRRILDGPIFIRLYVLSFLAKDEQGMTEQKALLHRLPGYEHIALWLDSQTDAYSGRLEDARTLTREAVASALQDSTEENAATLLASAAVREAALGNVSEAQRAASQALKLAPSSKGAESETALAFAWLGDETRAESLAQDASKRHPLDTQLHSLWLPTIRSQIALAKSNPAAAIERLQPSVRLELATTSFWGDDFRPDVSCMYWTYIRGEASLASGQGKAAVAEFQKILDHNGIVRNCWTGALAYLGLARALALQTKGSQSADAETARTRALSAYKDFLTLWKDADTDIPILKQAKAEYAKLQ